MATNNTPKQPIAQWLRAKKRAPVQEVSIADDIRAACQTVFGKASGCPECGSGNVRTWPDGGKLCRDCGATW